MSIPSYKSKDVFVPEGIVPAYAEESVMGRKLFNSSLKPKSKRYDPLKYGCDICRAFFAPTKFLVLAHKSTVHKIPIPRNS